MFDLIVYGDSRRPFHDHTIAPALTAVVSHALAIAGLVVVPLFFASDRLPEMPTMMAFVVTEPALPALPPPPPPARRASIERPPPVATAGPPTAAPVEAPSAIVAERTVPGSGEDLGVDGVEGGVAGGVVGGVIGGLVSPLPPPPPPPPPPRPTGPVRIGGQITTPALLHRVEPEYPAVAVLAQIGGTVILEATVAADGTVEAVKLLRSVKLLDEAAIAAVRQWQYSPLVLNGVQTPFILTVTLTFRIKV